MEAGRRLAHGRAAHGGPQRRAAGAVRRGVRAEPAPPEKRARRPALPDAVPVAAAVPLAAAARRMAHRVAALTAPAPAPARAGWRRTGAVRVTPLAPDETCGKGVVATRPPP